MSRRRDSGQASVELMMMLPLIFLIGLCVWQMGLLLNGATDAQDAARSVARSGGGVDDVRAALQPRYRGRLVTCGSTDDGDCTRASGGKVHVVVRVPIVAPFGDWGIKVHGDADLPVTDQPSPVP